MVESLRFSPDGKTLASGSFGGTIRLGDAVTGQHKSTLAGHTRFIRSLVFNPDGSTFATGGNEHIHLWDIAIGEKTGTFTGHRSLVLSLAFSPDGRTLASGGTDGTVLLWDLGFSRPAKE